jgi:hypothetical protein
MRITKRQPKFFCWAITLFLGWTALSWGQSDPQGALDSFYLECGVPAADTLLLQLRFASDNTDSNRIAGFGMPVLITVSNNALVHLDTTVATTYAGSMVSRFAIKTTDTDSLGGANPDVSPVHFVLGAVTFDSGATGEGVFANLKLILNGDTTTVTVDTLSTAILSPVLVTEVADSYVPGWRSGGFTCSVVSSVKDLHRGSGANLPSDFSLSQNYPNPFNATTVIEFALPQAGEVKLELYNILGQKIRTLVDQELSPGYKQVIWDGTDQKGEQVASGIYFYRLRAEGKYTEVKRMFLVK